MCSLLEFCRGGRSALMPPGGEDKAEKMSVADEIASPEAAGFAGEAVGPFEAEFVGPGGGSAAESGLGIERRADGDGEADGQRGAVAVHPDFLAGDADGDAEDVWRGCADCIQYGF